MHCLKSVQFFLFFYCFWRKKCANVEKPQIKMISFWNKNLDTSYLQKLGYISHIWQKLGYISHIWQKLGYLSHNWQKLGYLSHTWHKLGYLSHNWQKLGYLSHIWHKLGYLSHTWSEQRFYKSTTFHFINKGSLKSCLMSL